MKYQPIIAQNKEHLKNLIENEIKLHGNKCNLNHIDTSKIKDMNFLFTNSKFNGDIFQWKPISLRTNCKMYKDCSAPQPYWALINITSNEQMKQVINAYHLAKKLELDIKTKEKDHKKVKI